MTPLDRLIRRKIAASGPIPVADFMSLALNHPEHGYYGARDPLGRAGDFVTAPEISQIFGELVGLWAAATWLQMGSPPRLLLVECGPGRGTLMRDALRAGRLVEGFAQCVDLRLVETAAGLRRMQKAALSDARPRWHRSLDALPSGPMILIANEFLDALPVRQLVRTEDSWAERLVAHREGRLEFVVGEDLPDGCALVPPSVGRAERGTVFEVSPTARAAAARIGKRLARDGGAALFVDYGHDRSAPGETLQAVRAHRPADPLSRAGETDLTAHVDFEAVSDSLRREGACVHGPITQRQFLRALGAEQRTERLAAAAPPAKAREIRTATDRLTGSMGALFKALAATAPGMAAPAGFEEPC